MRLRDADRAPSQLVVRLLRIKLRRLAVLLSCEQFGLSLLVLGGRIVAALT